jgi:hypothetical protein
MSSLGVGRDAGGGAVGGGLPHMRSGGLWVDAVGALLGRRHFRPGIIIPLRLSTTQHHITRICFLLAGERCIISSTTCVPMISAATNRACVLRRRRWWRQVGPNTLGGYVGDSPGEMPPQALMVGGTVDRVRHPPPTPRAVPHRTRAR